VIIDLWDYYVSTIISVPLCCDGGSSATIVAIYRSVKCPSSSGRVKERCSAGTIISLSIALLSQMESFFIWSPNFTWNLERDLLHLKESSRYKYPDKHQLRLSRSYFLAQLQFNSTYFKTLGRRFFRIIVTWGLLYYSPLGCWIHYLLWILAAFASMIKDMLSKKDPPFGTFKKFFIHFFLSHCFSPNWYHTRYSIDSLSTIWDFTTNLDSPSSWSR